MEQHWQRQQDTISCPAARWRLFTLVADTLVCLLKVCPTFLLYWEILPAEEQTNIITEAIVQALQPQSCVFRRAYFITHPSTGLHPKTFYSISLVHTCNCILPPWIQILSRLSNFLCHLASNRVQVTATGIQSLSSYCSRLSLSLDAVLSEFTKTLILAGLPR